MKSSSIALLEIVLIIVIAFSATFFKIKKEHDANLWKVLNKEVIESANRCKNEDHCLEDKATINHLINNQYLKDVVINPITKEILNDQSYVDFTKQEFVILD